MLTMRAGSSSLCADLDVDAVADAPLAGLTWYGIGGRADLLVRPRTVEALATLVKRCRRANTPVRVLGSGANLLVADEGVDGVVLRLDEPVFRETTYNPDGEVNALRAMAGADMARTLMDTARRGLEGLSQMAGIPASIGGAIAMNAGGAFGCIGDAVRSVTCITRGGVVVTYPAAELTFGYRETNIPDPIVLSVVFDVRSADPIALRDKIKDIFQFKKSSQPLADHSAGCAFRNPIDPVNEQRVSAGRLIDAAGLKGLREGGAYVSPQHANFIVAEPGATTARNVLDLLDTVRRRVFDDCGIELQREVVVWGRGTEPGALIVEDDGDAA